MNSPTCVIPINAKLTIEDRVQREKQISFRRTQIVCLHSYEILKQWATLIDGEEKFAQKFCCTLCFKEFLKVQPSQNPLCLDCEVEMIRLTVTRIDIFNVAEVENRFDDGDSAGRPIVYCCPLCATREVYRSAVR